MAIPGVKYDDGSGGFASNCFPVKGLLSQGEEGCGAWFEAQQAEQRRRFKAVLCAKPRTLDQIREERRRAEKDGASIVPPEPYTDELEDDDDRVLDGFFLMKHCCVEDPADLCSVNISGQGLSEVKQEDFVLFDNVAYVNAAENILPFESFKYFPIIRELEMSLNALRNIKINIGDFAHLEMLDLSYNNLLPSDILPLGLMPNLKILHLTGNGLKTLPADLARPHQQPNSEKKLARFPNLEILMLEDNKLSDLTIFAALAGLRRLQHLNLAKNQIFSLPQLMVMDGRHVTQEIDLKKPKSARSKSGRSSRRSNKSPLKGILRQSPGKDQPEDAEEMMSIGRRLDSKTEVQFEGMENNADKKSSEDDLENMNFGELNLGELDDKIEAKIKEEKFLEQEKSFHIIDEGTLPPPFPELTYLNLAYNRIVDEEGLLAVAAWPMVQELVIHDNPLTLEMSGDPPILKRFLQDRLGMNIVRIKPGPLPKPNIELHMNPNRTVDGIVPKIPKRNIDDIIMAIEASAKPMLMPDPDSKASTPAPKSTTPTGKPRSKPGTPLKMGPGEPLPPISPAPSVEPEDQTEDTAEENTEEKIKKDAFGGDAFFMTQVDDGGDEGTTSPTHPVPPKGDKPKKRRMRRKSRPATEDKYKGYEVLLDVSNSSDEEDMPLPKDITGNVRALQYALNHPLVYRNNEVNLEKEHKPYQPYKRQANPIISARKTKQDKMNTIIDELREQPTLVEAPLEDILAKRGEFKSAYPQARQLLAEVQTKYNTVRTASMKEAREVKSLAMDMLEDVQKLGSI